MQHSTTHIIGAGLAGLSAAVELAALGRSVVIYEAAGHAGGRSRSYFDAAFGSVIDNGNHLLLSGNEAALAFLKRIGSENAFMPADKPVFHFVDAKTRERWVLRLSEGRLPFWLLDAKKRVPHTRFTDYFSILKLLQAPPRETITQTVSPDTELYHRLWHPLLISALNTHPSQASAQLAGAVVRGSMLKGGQACIPLVAHGLSAAFIEPALRYLSERKQTVKFNRRVLQIAREKDQVVGLEFASGETVSLAVHDTVICAVPARVAQAILPEIQTPEATRAILNAHFRIAPPAGFPALMGVIGATTEWIFAFPDRISVTVSDADRLMQEERKTLADRIWQEVSTITGLATMLPPWQIVKEKRATFAATPEQDAKRPDTLTAWRNLFLAGDWVQTGLPATIEGAIRSGVKAAKQIT